MTSISSNRSASPRSDVSLIVCTRNRSKKLKKCLSALEKTTVSDSIELVVIDNNSTDDTLAVISQHANTSKFPMRWCTETKAGTGAARNTGAEVATADILVYLDDDCYPEGDFAAHYQQIFTQTPELGFVGGRVELYDNNAQPITILTSTQERFFAAGQRLVAGEIISANLGVRRNALLSVNGWDEMFGAGTEFPCEDLDLAARILVQGWQGKYDPRPVVYHDHERNTHADVKKLMHYYDAGRGGFYCKCLLNRPLRKIYLWYWIKACLKRPTSVTLREVKSMINYLGKRKNSLNAH